MVFALRSRLQDPLLRRRARSLCATALAIAVLGAGGDVVNDGTMLVQRCANGELSLSEWIATHQRLENRFMAEVRRVGASRYYRRQDRQDFALAVFPLLIPAAQARHFAGHEDWAICGERQVAALEAIGTSKEQEALDAFERCFDEFDLAAVNPRARHLALSLSTCIRQVRRPRSRR